MNESSSSYSRIIAGIDYDYDFYDSLNSYTSYTYIDYLALLDASRRLLYRDKAMPVFSAIYN